MAIPFRDGGHDFSGADCWGIYALILHHEAGVSYPTIDMARRNTLHTIRAMMAWQMAVGDWVAVWSVRDGALDPLSLHQFDCVAMTAAGHYRAPLHVGTALGGGLLLHTETATGPRILPLTDELVRDRILGVYRPAALT